MNLFPIEYDNKTGKPCPVKSAQYSSDEHMIKIIMEAVQMMITAYFILYDKDEQWCGHIFNYACDRWKEMGHTSTQINKRKLPRKTHVNHPMNIWVRTSQTNYMWTAIYAHELCMEQLRRPLKNGNHSKPHMYTPYVEWFLVNIPPTKLFVKHSKKLSEWSKTNERHLHLTQFFATTNNGISWSDMPLCMDDECKVDDNGNLLDIVQAYRKWVNNKYNSYHEITIKRTKPRRKINWNRLPSRKPSYITDSDDK